MDQILHVFNIMKFSSRGGEKVVVEAAFTPEAVCNMIGGGTSLLFTLFFSAEADSGLYIIMVQQPKMASLLSQTKEIL